MDEALEMAEEAFEAREIPVGCVFVKDGHVIARARNRTNELKNATRHAELEAIDEIIAAGVDDSMYPLKRTTLYVTVEPCMMCASALRQSGIVQVFFGCENDRFGGCGSVMAAHAKDFHPVHPEFLARAGFRRDEAIMLLRRFYLTENVNAPVPKSKASRVLKTEIAPPKAAS